MPQVQVMDWPLTKTEVSCARPQLGQFWVTA
jgi:hypothetical protein